MSMGQKLQLFVPLKKVKQGVTMTCYSSLVNSPKKFVQCKRRKCPTYLYLLL